MKLSKGFFKLVRVRLAIFLYLFALITAGAMLFMFIPVANIVTGLLNITGSNALAGIVSLAQWISDKGTIKYTLFFIAAAPFPLAIAATLLFAGALGSFAAGMQKCVGFPATRGADFPATRGADTPSTRGSDTPSKRGADFPVTHGAGFIFGYRKRLPQVFFLFYTAFLFALLLIFIWIIAATPLAIIGELVNQHLLQTIVYVVTLAVTVSIGYLGLLFIRVYPMSFAPAFFSSTQRPVRSALSFAGRNFFRISKFFLAADVIQVIIITICGYYSNKLSIIVLGCLASALIVYFLHYVVFNAYAADGYGYDDGQDAAADGYGYDDGSGTEAGGYGYDGPYVDYNEYSVDTATDDMYFEDNAHFTDSSNDWAKTDDRDVTQNRGNTSVVDGFKVIGRNEE